MRKIAIAAAVSLSLTGISGVSYGLGLGEIEMYSALNQPLDAEIRILSATEAELQGMQVGLAPDAAFQRAGLQQLPVLSSVSFAVEKRPDGQPVVKILTDGPVLEPFLNFLIEVDAPGSVRLVREYTVLLDPPAFPSEDAPSTPAVATYASTSTDSNDGVSIDLTDAALVGSVAQSTDGQVSYSETTSGGSEVDSDFVITDASMIDTSDVFVSDDQVFATDDNSASDGDGQLISLEQELNTTPQFDEPVFGFDDGEAIDLGAESIALVDDTAALSLDNLGAEGDPIFDNDFASNDDVEVLSGDALRDLIEPVGSDTDSAAGSSLAQVEFEESTVSSDAVYADTSFSDSTFSDSTVADGETSYGDLIDLSGVIEGDIATPADVVTDTFEQSDSVGSSSTISSDGIVVEIADVALGGFDETTEVNEVTGESYRVQPQDTLWSIANRQKASGVSAHQMIVALLNANPDAFVGGNINRMSKGAVLEIPTVESQKSTAKPAALAIVKSWTDGNQAVAVPRTTPSQSVDVAPQEIVIDNTRLEEVNRQMEVARSELASEAADRDELQGRVNSLEDNMSEMKSLITLREDELNKLEQDVATTENAANALTAQREELDQAAESAANLQKDLTQNLTQAQDDIARQADKDKNMATAEAEAQSIRISSEEDSLRAQLAALEIEKRDLESSSQLEKADLVRQSELEKTRLLEEAKAEREKIMAELEVEKTRISEEAELEIARVKNEADTNQQQLLEDAKVERTRLTEETQQMKTQIDDMQAEKMRLLDEAAAEKARMVAEADAERAELEAKAAELKDANAVKLAEAETAIVDTDTDAEGSVDGVAGKIAAGGSAAVGGLLGFAPLQEMIGNRKTVLGAGAGLAGLGLLGAWAMRRRRKPVQDPALRPRGVDDRQPAPQAQPRTNFDSRPQQPHPQQPQQPRREQPRQPQMRPEEQPVQRSAAPAAAATAAAAAAAVGAGVAARDSHAAPEASVAPQTNAPQADDTARYGRNEPGVVPQNVADENLEEVALDDTITEAEVYLRYGLHGQAEDLLKTAIERSPDNEEYHFKLLENYHDQKNADSFHPAASTFTQKFGKSEYLGRINEMGAELGPVPQPTSGGNAGTVGLAAGAAGAVVAGTPSVASAMVNAKNNRSHVDDGQVSFDDELSDPAFDQTIDPGSEFSVDELQATGNMGAMVDDAAQFDNDSNMSLDDVDLASLDDDGTMNLEGLTGNQMSGADIGNLDLTNPTGDSTLDNLTLDDADLSSLGNVTGDIRSGLEADLPVEGLASAGSGEMENMLDLAKAYMDMGDNSAASKALKDIAAKGNPMQQIEANELLKKLT